MPCSRLAIAATEFDDPPAAGAAAITRFFQQPGQHAQQTQQAQEQLAQKREPERHPKGSGQTKGQPPARDLRTLFAAPPSLPPPALVAAHAPTAAVARTATVVLAAAAAPSVEDAEKLQDLGCDSGEERDGRSGMGWSPGGGGVDAWSEGEAEGEGLGGDGLGAYGGQHSHDHPAKRRRTAGGWEAVRGRVPPPGAAAAAGLPAQQHDAQEQQGTQQQQLQQQASLPDGSQQQALPASLAAWLPSMSQHQHHQQQQQQHHTQQQQQQHHHHHHTQPHHTQHQHTQSEGQSGRQADPQAQHTGQRAADASGRALSAFQSRHTFAAPPDLDPGGLVAPSDTGGRQEEALDSDSDPVGDGVAAPPPQGPVLVAGALDQGFGNVDLEEQRRILHEIELARLRALPSKHANAGRAAAGGGGRGGSATGGGGTSGGGRGRGRGAGKAHGRGAGAAQAGGGARVAGKGQMRLTALLQPGRGQQQQLQQGKR